MAQTSEALRELTEISTQIEAAVVLDREGTVVASTLDDERAGRLAGPALQLLRAAEDAKPDAETFVQLDASLRDGVVFLVADGDRVIAATTGPEPTAGLVFYDLKSCLRALGGEEKPKPAAKPRARRAPAKKAPAARTRKKQDDAGT